MAIVTDRQTGGAWTDHYVNFPWMSHCFPGCRHGLWLHLPFYSFYEKEKATQVLFRLSSLCYTTPVFVFCMQNYPDLGSCHHFAHQKAASNRSLCTNAYATVKDEQTHTRNVYTWTWKDLLSCTGRGGKVGGRALWWLLFKASLQAARACTCAWY